MGRRLVSLGLIAALILSLTACSHSKATAENVISPNGDKTKPELTILYYAGTKLQKNSVFADYTRKFEKQYGVKVNLSPMGDGNWSESDMENFIKKINTKLYAKEGPELIYSDSMRGNNLVSLMTNAAAVVELRDKVPNINKIYDGLTDKEVYYAPVGIEYQGSNVNKEVLEELGIKELGLEWELEDYLALQEKWRTYKKRYFTSSEFFYTTNKYFSTIKIFDLENKKVSLNTVEVKNAINSIGDEIFSSYLLDKDYKYENFYNMLYEPSSTEAKNNEMLRFSKEFLAESLWSAGYTSNSRLFARDIQATLDSGAVLLPEYKGSNLDLASYGFMVNKNGGNLELAYEFINGYLGDEIQLGMLQPVDMYQYYPVNKEIEEKLLKAELEEGAGAQAMDMKRYVLNKLKQGQAHLNVTRNADHGEALQYSKLSAKFIKEITKFIFADQSYSDEELSAALKKMEDEYTIWLNE